MNGYTIQLQQRFINKLRRIPNIKSTCDDIGITRPTFYNAIKKRRCSQRVYEALKKITCEH
jgi:predicted DNA-binding transcriptional regulator AlpA